MGPARPVALVPLSESYYRVVTMNPVVPSAPRRAAHTLARCLGALPRSACAAVLLVASLHPAVAATVQNADIHPRLLVQGADAKTTMRERLAHDPAAAKLYQSIKASVQPYVDRRRSDPTWIVSRLQMYWQAHSTDVYVKNGVYDHASGRAPVPTVRFTGTRDANSQYMTPKLEDVKPYMGERDMLYLQNKEAPGHPWEWVSQAKSGRIVEAINMHIAQLARDAAFLYWYTGDESYARFALDIFDTYMSGIYYRNMPIDLNHGHDQTLVGLQSFEVIHEDIATPMAETYDFLHDYVAGHAAAKRALYDDAFKKWADVIIANGVPWNNWNLIQARFVLQIAAALDPDASYADKRGSEHYVRAVLEGGGPRQWSLQRLLAHGYDMTTGVWNEAPGYSINVANDFMECVEMLDQVFGIDVLPRMPVLPRAARALPQYLLPNGRTVGFGDTRYELVRTAMVERLLAHAQRHHQSAQAEKWATLLAALRGAGNAAESGIDGFHALFARMDSLTATPARQRPVTDYQSPTFFTPNASWLVQRNGYLGDDAMAISEVGSSGNHAHANGIAMELFAKGLSLAPESGRGSGYLQNDHLEYYSQFAAHNTVVVDGISAYPSMKSNHPLTLQAVYPRPGSPAKDAFPWASFSDVRFLEPETNADQARVLGMVRLSDKTGYFVDIFRSRRRDGQDRYHDYIYHNLGQSMHFLSADDKPLATKPSEALSFADGDLIGYDYWHDRHSLASTQPLKVRFDLELPGRSVAMTAWLQGGAKREFFSVQAPPSTAWSAGMLPADLEHAPLPTLVIRQHGQAWTRPFTAVFEPTSGAPASVLRVDELISAESNGHTVALRVTTAGARRQTIVSGDNDGASYADANQRFTGRYGILAERRGALDYLFLGDGRVAQADGYALMATQDHTAAALWQQDGHWFYTASAPARLEVPLQGWPRELELATGAGTVRLTGTPRTESGRPVLVYQMPATAAARIR
jgi:hypothetical protein